MKTFFFSDELVKDVIDDMGPVLDPKSQSLISLDFQSPDGSLELEKDLKQQNVILSH
jgi:hypothetical protein